MLHCHRSQRLSQLNYLSLRFNSVITNEGVKDLMNITD
jgi:hypothetical protein